MTASKTSLEHSHRLNRIEEKIDKLAETLVAMARVEEKILALEDDKRFLMEKMVAIDSNLRKVERQGNETSSDLSMITRIFWIALSAVITSVVAMYITK